jgi:5-methylcytosine-specific restriction endonuclease McrA
VTVKEMREKPPVTPEVVHDIGLNIFAQVCHGVPPAIAEQLRVCRKTVRHGTRTSVFVFSFWDKRQKSGVVDPRYMKYELVFDPDHFYSQGTDWYAEFYLNPNRVYHHVAELIGIMEKPLRQARVKGFSYEGSPAAVALAHRFNTPPDIDSLPAMLGPMFVDLVKTVHPVISPFIESFTQPLSDAERRAFILGRAPARIRGVRSTQDEQERELSRGISKELRKRVLEAYEHCCAACGKHQSVVPDTLEMDHIKPVCLGGRTRSDNLQPLCRVCHDRKGPGELRYSPTQLRRAVAASAPGAPPPSPE